MPDDSKRAFWASLPVSDSVDLIDSAVMLILGLGLGLKAKIFGLGLATESPWPWP